MNKSSSECLRSMIKIMEWLEEYGLLILGIFLIVMGIFLWTLGTDLIINHNQEGSFVGHLLGQHQTISPSVMDQILPIL